MEWGWDTKGAFATAKSNIATGNSNIPDAWGGGTAPAPGAASTTPATTTGPATTGSSTPGKYSYAALDPETGTYSVYDPAAKSWTAGIKAGDVYGQLDAAGQAAHPNWYYGQEVDLANKQRQYDQDRQTSTYQRFAGMGTTTGYKFPDYGMD